jgi:hypothetical protein
MWSAMSDVELLQYGLDEEGYIEKKVGCGED